MSKEYVLVTTLSHFKIKYAIPADDFATLGFSEPIDTVKLAAYIAEGRVNEFSQAHLGEVVADVSVHQEDKLIELFDIDNSYLSEWPIDRKIARINKWQEQVE